MMERTVVASWHIMTYQRAWVTTQAGSQIPPSLGDLRSEWLRYAMLCCSQMSELHWTHPLCEHIAHTFELCWGQRSGPERLWAELRFSAGKTWRFLHEPVPTNWAASTNRFFQHSFNILSAFFQLKEYPNLQTWRGLQWPATLFLPMQRRYLSRIGSKLSDGTFSRRISDREVVLTE